MTIKQVCEKYGLTPDTLRYYEKIGVIPVVGRTAGGVRNYDDEAIGWVENAVCMRSAGVPVESIIEYVKLYEAGNETLEARRDLLCNVQTQLLTQKQQLDAALQRLAYKIRRYEKAMETGVLTWEDCEENAK